MWFLKTHCGHCLLAECLFFFPICIGVVLLLSQPLSVRPECRWIECKALSANSNHTRMRGVVMHTYFFCVGDGFRMHNMMGRAWYVGSEAWILNSPVWIYSLCIVDKHLSYIVSSAMNFFLVSC